MTAALLLIAEGALKGSGLLLVAAVLALALRRSSAAVRHMIWATAIVAVLLVVPLSRISPSWSVPVPFTVPAALDLHTPSRPSMRGAFPPLAAGHPFFAPAGRSTSLASEPLPRPTPLATALAVWLLGIWLAGAAVFAAWFLAGTIRLWRTVRAATAIDDDRIVELAEALATDIHLPRSRFRLRWTQQALTPMTWGIRRPFILLPAESDAWPDERLRQVLLHELAHIRRHDLITQALGSLACVVYWFNPLVWWAARQMLVERERACDDIVLASGTTPSLYAHELLELARSLGASWTTSRVSTAMARKSQISGRLLAVLDATRSRHAVRRRLAVVSAILAVVVLVPVCSLTLALPTLNTLPAAEPATPAMESTLREIGEAGRKWRRALNRGDARAIADLYTRDAVLVSSGSEPARGRDAIRRYMEYVVRFGAADIELYNAELHPVGDMVCQVGRVTTRSRTGVELGTSTFMSLWKKEDGEWRIHRDYVAP